MVGSGLTAFGEHWLMPTFVHERLHVCLAPFAAVRLPQVGHRNGPSVQGAIFADRNASTIAMALACRGATETVT